MITRLNFKDWKYIIHGVFIGIVVHGFILANDVPNWDDLAELYTDLVYTKNEGRWFLWFPAQFSSRLSMGWLNGILALIYISISAYLISKVLRIEIQVMRYLLLIIMLVFPSVSSTLFYSQCVDGYFFGLMLICLSVYILEESSKKEIKKYKYLSYLGGVVLSILSLGCYQAYFPFGCAVLIVVLIRYLLEGRDILTVVKISVEMLIAQIVSLIGYVVFTRSFFGNSLRTYMGISNMGKLTLKELLTGIIKSYKEFGRFYFCDSRNMHGNFTLLIIIGCLICIFLIMRIVYKKQFYRDPAKLAYLLLLVIVFPLGSNLIYAMGSEEVHVLMIYGLVAAFILAIMVLDLTMCELIDEIHGKRRLVHLVCIVGCTLIGIVEYKYILNDNMVYWGAHISYEQTYAYANRLVNKIESAEGFQNDDEIWLVGNVNYDVSKTGTAWMNETLLNSYTGISMQWMKLTKVLPRLMNRYIGSQNNYKWATPDELQELGIVDLFETMPDYPSNGSIVRPKDGIVVVKFSALE